MMPLHSDPTLLSLSKVTGIKLEFPLHHNPKVKTVKVTPPKCTVVDFTIRVINPERKRDAKTFILKGIELETFGTVKNLREEILEQLGRNVVTFMLDFGVGYMAGNQRICFQEKDQIGPQLLRLAKNGSQLWCEGLNPHSLKPRK